MIDFPKYLSIQTTSLCNAACVFCPYQQIKDSFPPTIMDSNLYKKIMDECSEHKTIERIILYMNNEPLTDHSMVERINYAKERVPWASVHILTNGSLLTEETAEKLIGSKLDWIGISFHGIRKETIEKAMGIPFESTLQKINSFIDKAKTVKDIKQYLMITFLRHEYLEKSEKDEAIAYWKARGVERVSYFDGPVSRAGNVKDIASVYHQAKIMGCNSIWADEMIHITEDGKVVLCCMDWRREVILGDLDKESIFEVWNGRRKDVWQGIEGQSVLPEDFPCRRCEEAKLSAPSDVPSKQEELLLVMAPPWQTKMVPMGLAYLHGYVSSQGIKAKVIDLNVRLFNYCKQDKKYFWDIATINSLAPSQLAQRFIKAFHSELEVFIAEALASPAKIVGFSTTIASAGIALYLAHQIKLRDPSRITIIGGPGCYWNTESLDPERLVDIFVIGEGERALTELVRKYRESASLSGLVGVQGTVVNIDKHYHALLPHKPLERLDDVPFPDFKAFDLEEYSKGSMYKPLPLLISRGCINNCSFCIDHKMSNPFRLRDPGKVVEEIRTHYRDYGVKDFEFTDLLCNGNPKQLEKICEMIIEQNLPIQWTSYAAIRPGMTLELCQKMRLSGCRYICYGMESGSNTVLKKMKKRYDSKLAEEVIRNTHNAGIETAINIILGHPGESEWEFKNTCAFIEKNREYIDQVTNVSTCFLMLETDLMNNLNKYGIYFRYRLRDIVKRVFLKRKFQPNYREFYVAPDNTPRKRAQWLRRFLKLLTRLTIPYVIVNYVKEHDKNLECFIEKLGSNASTLRYRSLTFDLSQKGQARLYFKKRQVTQDVGMNASFFTEGKWFDSSSAQWRTQQQRGGLSITIRWPQLPIIQDWRFRFGKGLIVWDVRISFLDAVHILQQKIGIMFSDKYDHYRYNGSSLDFPKNFTKEWQELLFSVAPAIELKSKELLPRVLLEPSFKSETFVQLQNSPLPLRARMFNCCFFRNDHPGGYNSQGRLFRKGDVIEGRIKIVLK